MKSLFFLVGVGITAISGAIIGGSAIWLFWDAWKSSDLEAFRALVGGFSGAFFAYLFVRFGDALKKLYDRKELNHTTLVKLQHYFNDCLNTTSDNLFIVKDCQGTFTEARRSSPEVPIYMNSFRQYQVNRDLVTNLTNVDFLNEVYSLNVSLHKINDSLATIDRSYAQLRDSLLSKNVDPETYKVNAWRYRDRCAEIQGFLLQLKEDLIRLFAAANLLLANRPYFVRVLHALVRTSYSEDFVRRLERERVRVTAEMEAIAQKSAERIQEAQRK